jgi:exodeoxyribonuclease V alpha subunit
VHKFTWEVFKFTTVGKNIISEPIGKFSQFPFRLAWAVTIHKSQGSEYDQVLLVLPEETKHRLLTQEIIYTGLTRAKYLAVIYGSTNALKTAITTRIQRDSGLSLWGNA